MKKVACFHHQHAQGEPPSPARTNPCEHQQLILLQQVRDRDNPPTFFSCLNTMNLYQVNKKWVSDQCLRHLHNANACALLAVGRDALDQRSGRRQVAWQKFLAALWGSHTKSPNYKHECSAHRNCTDMKRIVRILDLHTYAIIRWGGSAFSALSTMDIFNNETTIIFSSKTQSIMVVVILKSVWHLVEDW